jgi:hypothetical protein
MEGVGKEDANYKERQNEAKYMERQKEVEYKREN